MKQEAPLPSEIYDFRACSFPAVLAICHGDPEVREAYSGDLKADKLRDFVLKYAGGRRCSKCELTFASLCAGSRLPPCAALDACKANMRWVASQARTCHCSTCI